MKSYAVKALQPVKTVDLPKLDSSVQRRIKKKIDQIRSDPHRSGKPLGGELVGLYKVRVGKFRIVYQVRERELLILIIAIAHQEEIYDLASTRAG